jgi:glucosamine--fructose-6-phosphate aminotransferase (isomerizing)
MNNTPFEINMAEQAAALRGIASRKIDGEITRALQRKWERVVFTGMGSSHYATHPLWSQVVAHGVAAWNVDSGVLLDNTQLLTEKTLVVATSQSGASGEVVELLNQRKAGQWRCGYLLGITANDASPLAREADAFANIASGDEATVSTKSYLNSLATLLSLQSSLLGSAQDNSEQRILAAADVTEKMLASLDVSALAQQAIASNGFRLAAVAKGSDVATALYAALITKEASKVAIEGYAGGEFRHGPFELAGSGLTTFIYGLDSAVPDVGLIKLAKDILATGAQVVAVGDQGLEGARQIQVAGGDEFVRLVLGAVVAQKIAVEIAKANAVVPGAFAYGRKVTTAF